MYLFQCLIISFLMAFNAKLFDLAEIFILHRLLAGIGIGMVTTVQTVYLTEISPGKNLTMFFEKL